MTERDGFYINYVKTIDNSEVITDYDDIFIELLQYEIIDKVFSKEELPEFKLGVGDFAFMVGNIENKNDYDVFCDFNVKISVDILDVAFGSNKTVVASSKDEFAVFIELPDGHSDIHFNYVCAPLDSLN